MVYNTGTERPLREHLQAGTKAVHDRLDQALTAGELFTRPGYARFMDRQLIARDPIEQWANRHCPVPMRPPSVIGLLRADLAELSRAAPADEPRSEPTPLSAPPSFGPFVLPAQADPLGLAWAIAGSQMGNRAILARMRKAVAKHGAAPLPSRFLGDTRMTGFWHQLLPRLQVVVNRERAEPALCAAMAVFARFEHVFAHEPTCCQQAA